MPDPSRRGLCPYTHAIHLTLTPGRQLTWFDRLGVSRGVVGPDKPLADIGAAGVPTFDLAPDGKRVAALIFVETPEQSHVTFVLNFGDEPQRKMPVRK